MQSHNGVQDQENAVSPDPSMRVGSGNEIMTLYGPDTLLACHVTCRGGGGSLYVPFAVVSPLLKFIYCKVAFLCT